MGDKSPYLVGMLQRSTCPSEAEALVEQLLTETAILANAAAYLAGRGYVGLLKREQVENEVLHAVLKVRPLLVKSMEAK